MKCINCGRVVTDDTTFTSEMIETLNSDGQIAIGNSSYEYDSSTDEVTFICPYCKTENKKSSQEFINDIVEGQTEAKEEAEQQAQQQTTQSATNSGYIDIPDPTLLSLSMMKIDNYKSSLESFASGVNGLAGILDGLDVDVSGIDGIATNVSKMLNTDSEIDIVYQQLNDTKTIIDEKVYNGNFDLYAAIGFINLIGENPLDSDFYGMNLSNTEKIELFHKMREQIETNKDKYTLSATDENGGITPEAYDGIVNTLSSFETMFLLSGYSEIISDNTDMDATEVAPLTPEDYFASVEKFTELREGYVQELFKKQEDLNAMFSQKKAEFLEHPELISREKVTDEFVASQLEFNNDYQQLFAEVTGLCEAVQILDFLIDYNYQKAFSMYMESDDYEQVTSTSMIKEIGIDYEWQTETVWDGGGGSYDNTYETGKYVAYDKNGNKIELSALQLAKYCHDNGVALPENGFGHLLTTIDGQSEIKDYQSEWIPYLSDDEISILTYLEKTNGERYDEYYAYLKNKAVKTHGYEEAQVIIDQIDGYYEKVGSEYYRDKAGMMAVSIMPSIYTTDDADGQTLSLLASVGFKDGLKQFGSGLKNFLELDGSMTVEQYKTQYLLSNLKERYGDRKLMDIFSTGAYEISTSIGNMLPSVLVSMIPGFQGLGLGLMGASAAGNATRTGLQKGMRLEAAWLYGILNGASEIGLQYFLGGLVGLKGDNGFATKLSELLHIPNFLADMLAEGTEESLQSILEPMFATIVTGGEIPFHVDMKEVLKSGIYGIITAGIMNGGQVVIGGTLYTITNDMIPDLIESFKGHDLTNTEEINNLVEQLEELNADELTWEDEIIEEETSEDEIIEGIYGIESYENVFRNIVQLPFDETTKTMLKEILYKGRYGDFMLDSEICNLDNYRISAYRRLSMAQLLLTNPETFNYLAEHNINLFHGTNANALPSILKYGLLSGEAVESIGEEVRTGEEWSRNGRQRDFVSFTDILDISEYYASMPAQNGNDLLSFEVIVGTTVDAVEKKRLTIHSSVVEVGVRNGLTLEDISVLLVPADKVDFVKNMVGDLDIEVLPVNINSSKPYYYGDFGTLEIYDTSTFMDDYNGRTKPIDNKAFTMDEIEEFIS